MNGAAFYTGFQTNVAVPESESGSGWIGKGAIFSRWDERNLEYVRTAPGGWSVSSGTEGEHLSVRQRFEWGKGNYRMNLFAEGPDERGEWFGVEVENLDTKESAWIGSIRFPFKPDSEQTEFWLITTHEFYGYGKLNLDDIPHWKIGMEMPLINGDITSFMIHTRYNEHVPHSNVSFDDESKTITLEIGTGVVRETEAGILVE